MTVIQPLVLCYLVTEPTHEGGQQLFWDGGFGPYYVTTVQVQASASSLNSKFSMQMLGLHCNGDHTAMTNSRVHYAAHHVSESMDGQAWQSRCAVTACAFTRLHAVRHCCCCGALLLQRGTAQRCACTYASNRLLLLHRMVLTELLSGLASKSSGVSVGVTCFYAGIASWLCHEWLCSWPYDGDCSAAIMSKQQGGLCMNRRQNSQCRIFAQSGPRLWQLAARVPADPRPGLT